MSEPILLHDAAHTAELGARLLRPLLRAARSQDSGALVLLDGPLGAGKSTLARGLLRAAGVAGALPSPTFALLALYRVAGLDLYHLDLYRLGDSDELALLGLAQMRVRGALTLVEWGGNAPQLAAGADLAIVLHYVGTGRRAGLDWRAAPEAGGEFK